ncbi:MAG: YihY/virulence factor BrkB family protein [Bacteroidota bacterium]|nr:YihY/virulence factor BrkB family protein [Bacteroidota bacterium]
MTVKKSFFRTTPGVLKESFLEFIGDNVLKLSAALAYYTIFSLPSMLIVIIGLCSIFYGKDAVQGEVFFQIDEYVGAQAALDIQHMLQNTTLKHDNFLATALGLITLLVAATGMFGEIQDSINTIWGLKAKPKTGILKLILNRLLSFSMVIVMGFILLVSLLLSALLESFFKQLRKHFSEELINSLVVIDHILMFGIIVLLFAFIFKALPDAKVKWRDVWRGALVTAILFLLGKMVIGYYLDHNSMISAYGAAGSLIGVLLWVYYSAMILYFGAEFTQVYVRHQGRRIEPNKYAVWVEKNIVEKKYNTDIEEKVKTIDNKIEPKI